MTTLVEYGTRCLYENTNFYSVLIVRSASWLKLKVLIFGNDAKRTFICVSGLCRITWNYFQLQQNCFYVNTSTCFSKDAENLTTYVNTSKYKYLFLERCRQSNNVWLRALMQSDCLYSSLFFEHYNRILLCEWVIELCSVLLIDGVSSHNAFAFYLD